MNNLTQEILEVPVDILETLVNVICENTGLSIGLFQNGYKAKTLIPDQSRRNFTEICNTIYSTNWGRKRCNEDHIERAKNVHEVALTVCHAGLINLSIPIRIGREIKAVLLCGQRRPEDPILIAESKQKFNTFLESMKNDGCPEWNLEFERNLKKLYRETKLGSADDFKNLTKELSIISNWIYWAHDELTKINNEKKEVQIKKDEALWAAKFLIHDMAEQIQRIIIAAYIVYNHSLSTSNKKRYLKSDISFLKSELYASRDSLKKVNREFNSSIKIPPKKQFEEIIQPSNEAVIKNLLDVFCESTQLAIGLFERSGSKRTFITEVARNKFTSYCQTIWSHRKGKEACDSDHIIRASAIDEEGLTLCHAGLYNYGIPIKFENKTVACLLCGQRRVDNQIEKTRKRHISYISCLASDYSPIEGNAVIEQLKRNYEVVDVVSQKFIHIEKFRNLAKLCEWMYNQHEQLILSLTTRNRIIDDYESIVEEEKSLYHDIVQLEVQAIMDMFASLQFSVNNFPFSLESEAEECSCEMLNVLDGAKHRLWFSKAALFAWEKKHKIHMNLVELIDRCIYELTVTAARKNVVFEFTKPKVSMNYFGNYYELYIALWNIFHNAVKYSHSGFHRIEGINISIWIEIDDSRYRIFVQNFGVGILDNEDSSIYEPGKRGELAKKERPYGAGRGLSEALRILKANGCSLSHESKVVEGERYVTTFFIDVPNLTKGESNENNMDRR